MPPRVLASEPKLCGGISTSLSTASGLSVYVLEF